VVITTRSRISLKWVTRLPPWRFASYSAASASARRSSADWPGRRSLTPTVRAILHAAAAQHLGDSVQDRVAVRVAVLVVQELEVVQVERDQR
jgi:hypothetical protein